MQTFLITNTNSVIATEKDRIMEKSSLVDKLQFIVEKTYNDFDMKDFDLVIEGYLPITHEIQLEVLEMVDDNYKDLYYAYQLPVNSGITKEPGDMLFNLTFMKSEMDSEGIVKNYVRKIETGTLKIIPVANWFTAPDSEISKLNQLYLQNQQSIKALKDIADQLSTSAPNDIKLNATNKEVYLTSNGSRVGAGIGLATLKEALNNVTDNQTINI